MPDKITYKANALSHSVSRMLYAWKEAGKRIDKEVISLATAQHVLTLRDRIYEVQDKFLQLEAELEERPAPEDEPSEKTK